MRFRNRSQSVEAQRTELARLVSQRADEIQTLTDDALVDAQRRVRQALNDGATATELLVPVFALCVESVRRSLGVKYRISQIEAGIALHQGAVVDMKTGEGKTLACVIGAVLAAYSGLPVHIATANPYLAERDATIMGPVYASLGITSACILPTHGTSQRQHAYTAQVVYGTVTEFGFDYLRDNIAQQTQDQVHQPLGMVIVDEADSVLVDEANTPLVISGQAPDWGVDLPRMARLVQTWRRGEHFDFDREDWVAWCEDAGLSSVSTEWQVAGDLNSAEHAALAAAARNAVTAASLYRRDEEYIVADGSVHVVDSHTGRVLPGRRFSGGLHQALEAKEGVEIRADIAAQAEIAVHSYLRLYPRLAGLTGTTVGVERELHQVYKTDVVPINRFRPNVRRDHAPRVFANAKSHARAVAADVAVRVAQGQPVLVGAATVAQTQQIAGALRSAGLAPQVLNAATLGGEAAVIAEAGVPGTVTVATNMAGRGTDIMLGGDPGVVGQTVAEHGHRAASSVGGLCVIGTSLNPSKRVDDQLRGRCGRQGDPGETRFYYSLDDPCLADYGVEEVPVPLTTDDTSPLPDRYLRYFQNAQREAEEDAALGRKENRRYDDVLDSQRRAVYADRQRILEGVIGDDEMLALTLSTFDRLVTEWEVREAPVEELSDAVIDLCPFATPYPGPDVGEPVSWLQDQLIRHLKEVQAAWIAAHGMQGWMTLCQRVLLGCIDEGWRKHLEAMSELREAVALRAVAGRNIHTEFAVEGSALYEDMMADAKALAPKFVFVTSKRTVAASA